MKLMSSVTKLNRKIGTVLLCGMAVVTSVITVTSGLPFRDIASFLGLTYLILGLIYGAIRFISYIFE